VKIKKDGISPRVRAMAMSSTMVLILSFFVSGTANAQWYSGGTLHKAEGNEWVIASRADRLATSADLAITIIGKSEIVRELGSMDQVRPYAVEMMTCIDGMYNSAIERQTIMRAKSVSEVGSSCAFYVQNMWRKR
jgi:hypothetical protein